MDDGEPLEALRKALVDAAGPAAERVAVAAGERLFTEGERADAMCFVVTGRLEATARQPSGEERALATVGPGEPVGELGVLAGGVRTATLTAVEDSELVRVPAAAVTRVERERPALVEHLATVLRRRVLRSQLAAVLPALVGPLDGATLRDVEAQVEWVSLRGGDVLCREGEAGDSVYILLSGRLRAVAPDETGTGQGISEVAPGEMIGEMALVTGEPRSATVHAVRDSGLARLSRAGFEQVHRRHPQVATAVARTVAQRLRRREGAGAALRPVATVAVVPVSQGVPLRALAERLAAALGAFGPTLHLHSDAFDRLTCIPGAAQLAPDAPRSACLGAWLDEQEARHRFVVFEPDPTDSTWTRRCVRQADAILLLAMATADPSAGQAGADALAACGRASAARRSLVLLHRDGSRLPAGTGRWLDLHEVDDHHHVRLDTAGDVDGLARFLAGRSVGLVLGGGGARGLAHIGVVRALREAGVPIDMIAGTSMGALVAAGAAMGNGYDALIALGKQSLVKAKPHREYTLPLVALNRSRRIDGVLQAVYGDTCIEDLWLPFFCVSCNLTTCEMVVHRRGPLWRAVRASVSLPGVFVPVVEGHDLLVDGGVLNNLPGDVMRRFSAGPLIVVDAGAAVDVALDGPEFPSPWRLAWDRLLRRRRPRGTPSIFDILGRTVTVSSEHRARQVRRDADLCLRPPVADYGMLEFGAIEQLARLGYDYARKQLAGLAQREAFRDVVHGAAPH